MTDPTTNEPVIDVVVEGKEVPGLWQEYARFKAYLSDPNVLEAVSAHEAGHEFYFREIGGIDFEYFGPRIVLRRTESGYEFDCLSAMVRVKAFSPACAQLSELTKIGLVARASVAGGSVSKVIMKAADRGDQDDFELFKAACDKMVEKPDALTLWKLTQPKIDAEVADPVREAEILSLARKIKPLLFKWLR